MKKYGNIAIVHDWLVSMRGGEKVLEVLCELFPEAALFTLIHQQGASSPGIENMNIRTSFLQHVPFAKSRHQYFLPLYPSAIEQFDLREYDLVISSSHAVAKGVRVRNDAVHVCYCHTPMRYIWDQYEHYFGPGKASLPVRTMMRMLRGYLQRWDVESSKRVNRFIANSQFVRERIRRMYNRDAEVIYPPVETDRFSVSMNDDGYYLVVSALVPYKRIDIAVDACTTLGKRLVVVGSGSELAKLKLRAGSNVEFIGRASDEEINEYYRNCTALVFPGEEDFGIVPVEAMACGKPVIALRKGGVRETVVEGTTGMFFQDQTPAGVMEALRRFDKNAFDPVAIRNHSLRFDRKVFIQNVSACIANTLNQ